MSDDATASRDSKQEVNQSDVEFVRAWMDAIELQTKEEGDWRKRADETVKVFRSQSETGKTKERTFNILHSNIETTVPAIYNSTPVPDVRRRYQDNDPAGKEVADLIERCISYSVDAYDFDNTILSAVQDNELAGRGVTRIRYVPYLNEDESAKVYEEATCEHVQWKNFRRGPGRVWSDVPWEAFELFLSREQLVKLNPKLGNKVNLDCTAEGVQEKSDGTNVKEIFKRAKVWEIWDKDAREVIFIAESMKEQPLRREKDPLGLTGFFCTPRPLYAIDTSDSLVPVIPYDIYRDQAEELEKVSSRIMALVDALKAKGAYDGRMTELGRLAKADDNELVAVENALNYAEGGLEKAIAWWPIDVIAAVLEKLYVQRDQIKQAIYEITGIADILRGQSDPNETLGAQEIKQQWGSMRIQRKQMEVQRYARDLFRLKAEIIANKFDWQTIQLMTGLKYLPQAQKQQAQQMQAMAQQGGQPIQIPPDVVALLNKPSQEEVEGLLRDDVSRAFRIDVESDSTIRADMTRNQQYMSQFLEGTAQYMQAVGPAVQEGVFPADIAVEIYSAFARNFKLGKQAEDALDRLADQAKKSAQQPPKPDPKAEAEKIKAEAVQMKAKLDAEAQQQKMQMEAQKGQMELQAQQQKHQMELQKMQAELQMQRDEMQIMREQMGMEMQAKREEMALDAQAQHQQHALDAEAMERKAQLDERTAALQAEGAEHKHTLGMEALEAKTAAQKAAAKAKPKNGARA
jgi:hypothetical protein